MAHIRLYHKETGKHVDVWSVDAKELLAGGEYAVEDPKTGMQEGVPGETVMRPFDPTIHREAPGSHAGDVVVTAPMSEGGSPARPPEAPPRVVPAPGTLGVKPDPQPGQGPQPGGPVQHATPDAPSESGRRR